MSKWVKAINSAAATTSAPALPPPVTSARSAFRVSPLPPPFNLMSQRPVLPDSRSTETPEEMLSRFRAACKNVTRELEAHEATERSLPQDEKLARKVTRTFRVIVP